MPAFAFDSLRRFPDAEAPNLFAVDASDRLILDEAASALVAAAPGSVVVIGDRYGALTLGAAALHGATRIRVHQDAVTGEQALAGNAARAGLGGSFESLDLEPALVRGATAVLLQLPRSLAALEEIADLVARHADPSVVLVAGGRIKHLTPAMNDVLGASFGEVRASLARQKSRVLVAAAPRPAGSGGGGDPAAVQAAHLPRREYNAELGLWIAARGAAFAGTKLDIGTRFLLSHLDRMNPLAGTAIDLGSGTGILAAALARARPELLVIATDQSAAAVASTRETLAANGLAERVTVLRDNALAQQPDRSADLILCNPPFHVGSAVHSDVAHALFADARRVLAPGGELWTVFNSPLSHAAALRRLVGPTEMVGTNAKFTVTVSRRR